MISGKRRDICVTIEEFDLAMKYLESHGLTNLDSWLDNPAEAVIEII